MCFDTSDCVACVQLPAGAPTDLKSEIGNRRIYLSFKAPAYNGGRPVEKYMVEIAHDSNSRKHCSDPHGCVLDVLAHQALIGKQCTCAFNAVIQGDVVPVSDMVMPMLSWLCCCLKQM
jgi:hypothetical protein